MSSFSSGEYTWNINNENTNQMQNANNKQHFTSDIFKIAELNWQLAVFPNGKREVDKGSFRINLVATSFPMEWKSAITHVTYRCNETKSARSNVYIITKDNKLFGWGTNVMLFDEIRNLNQLSMTINITILKIILQNNEILYQQPKPIPTNAKITWNIDKSLFSNMKLCHNGKLYESPLYYDIWCLRIAPNGIKSSDANRCILSVQLAGLPPDTSKVRVKRMIRFILDGKTTKTINCDYSSDFDYGKSMSVNWGKGHLKHEEMQ